MLPVIRRSLRLPAAGRKIREDVPLHPWPRPTLGYRSFFAGAQDRCRGGLRSQRSPALRAIFGENLDSDGVPSPHPPASRPADVSSLFMEPGLRSIRIYVQEGGSVLAPGGIL